MRVLHSFHLVREGTKGNMFIPKELMYIQVLSALLAKKNYGNIHFYTTQEISKQVQEIGIPYDSIDCDVLSGLKTKTFSIPKLKVFEAQKEPYIHIDTDTLLFDKLPDRNNVDILYPHPDMGSGFDLVGQIRSYYALFYVLEDQHTEFKIKNLNINDVPNFNFIVVKNPHLFSKATKKSLKHYYKNKRVIDKMTYGACYIEQLMIHLNLMEISEEYYNATKKGEIFYSDVEFTIKKEENISNLYPITLIIPKLNNEFGFYEKKIINDDSLIRLFENKFNRHLHLTSHKYNKLIQVLCMGQIAHNFGEKWLHRIHDYYGESKSEGETLYEKLTGFKF